MNDQKIGRIEIAKQAMNFSAAHFTIFNATEREDLHGHNFQVECELAAPIDENGLIFDYNLIKKTMKGICDEMDEKTLLPEKSPFLKLVHEQEYLVAEYHEERSPFLYRDVLTLPIANVSVEELSHYYLDRLISDKDIAQEDISAITVRISSSPGQFGSATWVTDS